MVAEYRGEQHARFHHPREFQRGRWRLSPKWGFYPRAGREPVRDNFRSRFRHRFQSTPTGTLTVLSSGLEGAGAGLVQATNGNFYGTTTDGGSNGDGTVFEITPEGKLSTLHNFAGPDGAQPGAALVQAANGNLYGTTSAGGASTPCDGGCGTVFEMTLAGKLTTLYSFCTREKCDDGSIPSGGLVQATSGNFYGTTSSGGTSTNCVGGCGIVFQITSGGKLTVLHSFQRDIYDGASPNGLVQATNGNLYGTASEGGASDHGTVFEITPEGALVTLYSFGGANGFPNAGLMQASDGNFYGTTLGGGAHNDGTIFKITSAGVLTTLHSLTELTVRTSTLRCCKPPTEFCMA